MKWRLSAYTIAVKDGKRGVWGLTCDVFGIHKSDDAVNRPWTLTHLATGLAVGQRFRLRSQARAFAEAIRPLHDTWNFKNRIVGPHARTRDGRNLIKAFREIEERMK